MCELGAFDNRLTVRIEKVPFVFCYCLSTSDIIRNYNMVEAGVNYLCRYTGIILELNFCDF